MKSNPKIIISVAVLLTGLVHITVGLPNLLRNARDYHCNAAHYDEIIADFGVFMERLKTILKSPEAEYLSWISKAAKPRLIEDLRKTSFIFRRRCAFCAHKDDILIALKNDVIDKTFEIFEPRAKEVSEELNEIKGADPIGFMAYLESKNVDEESPKVSKNVKEYHKKMWKDLYQHCQGEDNEAESSTITVRIDK